MSLLAKIKHINEYLTIEDVINMETSEKVLQEELPKQICCFFHNDSTPSMMIYPGNRGCHCFGCGKTWMPYSFIKQYHNFSTFQTLQYVEKEYNIDMSHLDDYEDNEGSEDDIVQMIVTDIREHIKEASPKIKTALAIAIDTYYRKGSDHKLWKLYEKYMGAVIEL